MLTGVFFGRAVCAGIGALQVNTAVVALEPCVKVLALKNKTFKAQQCAPPSLLATIVKVDKNLGNMWRPRVTLLEFTQSLSPSSVYPARLLYSKLMPYCERQFPQLARSQGPPPFYLFIKNPHLLAAATLPIRLSKHERYTTPQPSAAFWLSAHIRFSSFPAWTSDSYSGSQMRRSSSPARCHGRCWPRRSTASSSCSGRPSVKTSGCTPSSG